MATIINHSNFNYTKCNVYGLFIVCTSKGLETTQVSIKGRMTTQTIFHLCEGGVCGKTRGCGGTVMEKSPGCIFK